MNKLLRTILAGTAALALTGCTVYQTGTIVKEYGTFDNTLTSSQIKGFFISGETVKIANSYVLQIKTEDGIYTASVNPRNNISLEALSTVLKEGDRIKFEVGGCTDNYFNKSKIGKLYADTIEVLSEK
jgi:molybdopterin converting factor small subunit